MGLLDKLTKAGINELKDKLEDKLEDKLGIDLDGDNNTSYNAPSSQATQSNPTVSASQTQAVTDWKAYFREILATEFSDYSVAEDVSAAQAGFAAASPCLNYSFVLSRGGRTVGAVMLTDHNRDRSMAFKNAKNAAGNKFINFYTHMPNERDFVIYRINRFI